MPNVWYVGRGSRTISWQEWAGYGIAADSISWNSYNAWSISHDTFTEDQLNVLENDNEFLLGQTGPRLEPSPFLMGEFSESGYAYYARILEIYNSLVDQGIIVNSLSQLTDITSIGLAIATAEDAEEVRDIINIDDIVAPIRFSSPVAIVGVTASDRAYIARTLVSARMRVASAPLGSDLVVQVQHYNGFAWVTIGTLTIAASSVIEASTTFSQAQAVGNLVRLNVTSVGSTTAATGIAVDVMVTNG